MICPFHYVQCFLSKAVEHYYPGILQDYSLECLVTNNKDRQKKGDFSSPIAFSLGKILKEDPKIIAEKLYTYSKASGDVMVRDIQHTGGYINIWMSKEYWKSFIPQILQTMAPHDLGFSTSEMLEKIVDKNTLQLPPQKYGFGYSHLGKGKKVNIEYVSANPTGPLHGAHGRGAILGDVLANLFVSQGYDVCREYFINDAGQQVSILGDTILLHLEAMEKGTEAIIPSGFYPGSYVRDIAEDYVKNHGYNSPKNKEDLQTFAVHWIMEDIKKDLHNLGIVHDVFTSEKDLHKSGKVQRAISMLEKGGYVYEGILETPDYEGKKVKSQEIEKSLLLFRSTDFGDDHDRALKNKEGCWTYFAGDIAYHLDKIERKYDLMVDVWGADHGGHVPSVTGGIKALENIMYCHSPEDEKKETKETYFNVELYQMVHFYKNGQAVKMSKRAGNVLSLSQVLSDIPWDVLRFMMIHKKADTHLTLNYEDMLLQGKENPVFYIHYAHARSLSVLRHALNFFSPQELMPKYLEHVSLDVLDHHEALWNMIHLMSSWPRTLGNALKNRHPHLVAHYAYDLAQGFHQLWNEGNQEDSLRFLQPQNKELSLAFMAFVQSFVHILRTSMGILGIGLKEEMR